MTEAHTTPLFWLYDNARAFHDQLEMAIENARTEHERDQLWDIWDIEKRYLDKEGDAELSDEEHDLITRLAAERLPIGPTDV